MATDLARAFADGLCDAAAGDERVCLLVNDSAETHEAVAFSERFPDRFIDVGIAEQNLVGLAIGLANVGMIPFVHSAACFVTSRALEQLRNAAYMESNIKVCGFVAGMAYGALGGTHHALDDLAWTRAIPRLRVISPATPADARSAVAALLLDPLPAYVRISSKLPVSEVFDDGHRFVMGSLTFVADGADVIIISTGAMTVRSVEAARLLADRDIEATVVHVGSIQPLDVERLRQAVDAASAVVIVEDHHVVGGLGSMCSELRVVKTKPLLHVGVPDEFPPVGPVDFLYEYYGLNAERLASRIAEWLAEGPR